DKSTSEMIRTLLFIGIKSFHIQIENKKKDTTIKSNNIRKNIDFKKLREQSGLTTAAIATFSCISEDDYIAIENGLLVPTKETFNSINDVFTTILNK
ncbi:MAG: helix-turn-helix transcriptional regulator, partial [Megamonas funiformis]|uniref:helix-turn-helix domain-containing protein n=1 Tax=Megamonas funiformis TaxID=437897 RepID=UPI001EB654D7